MDSRRLQHFVAVVDHGGFTAASRATFVSQPALSLAVKELEAELGIFLFDRIGRRVQLTDAGHALIGPARQVLRDIDTGREAVEAVSGLESGVLSLASLPTLAADPTADLGRSIPAAPPWGFASIWLLPRTAATCSLRRDRDMRVGTYRRGGRA